MASAAFREEGEPAGSEMVRRLLNQSIRMRASAAAARPARPFRLADEPQPRDQQVVDQEIRDLQLREQHVRDQQARELAELEDEIDGLEAELRVVRAALQAEQAESAALRAELEKVSAFATPVGDIRHDRDRWATLVERLLFVER